MYGTFGHGFSEPAADGGLHGPIPPYGPVNAAGLIGNLAILMGRKCGVADPEVAAAIDRGSRFFGYYVDKGAIPYGEHMPWPHHDNNGKNAMAAAFFALQGDRPQESRFFAKMVTASSSTLLPWNGRSFAVVMDYAFMAQNCRGAERVLFNVSMASSTSATV